MRGTSTSGRARLLGFLVVASVLLVLGVTLPLVRFERATGSDTHSVLSGIWALLAGGNVLLGAIVLAFSVVFPFVKLGALLLIWARRVEDERGKITWLGLLGKWSMLDVYVVAAFVGAVQLGVLAEVRSRYGLYVFAAAVLASMAATSALERARGVRQRLVLERRGELRRGPGRWMSLAAAGLLAAGLALPLMTVEKWIFWSNEYSVLASLAELPGEGEAGLAALLAVFVVLLPAAQVLGLLLARWVPGLPERALRVVLAVEEWAMVDVFALALLVVLAKVLGMASVEPRIGLACLLAAAVVTALDAWLARRTLRGDR